MDVLDAATATADGQTLDEFYDKAKLTVKRREMLDLLKIGSTSGILEVVD